MLYTKDNVAVPKEEDIFRETHGHNEDEYPHFPIHDKWRRLPLSFLFYK
jgi:hypothetical protein